MAYKYTDEPEADLYLDDDPDEDNKPMSPYKTLEIDYKQFDFEEDDKCQNEFKRFLIATFGDKRGYKYLNGFIKLKSNDIRFVTIIMHQSIAYFIPIVVSIYE